MSALHRSLGSLFSPAGARARLAVFCYHQVPETKDRMRMGEPDAAEFRRDVETIGACFNVMPFGEAAERLANRRLPARAAVITFDDGYANNHDVAAPILEGAGVPATFFVCGGAVDKGVMWNDLVIEARALNDDGQADKPLPQVLESLKYLPMAERWQRAKEMYVAAAGAEPPRLMMTREMVAALERRGFEIGGHTINHPILSKLDDDEARHEIASCADWIETVTGRRPVSFAYPNGVPGKDFESRHMDMVREAGFPYATSTEWAVAGPGSNSLAIPRIGPWWRQGRGLAVGLVRAYLKSYLRP